MCIHIFLFSLFAFIGYGSGSSCRDTEGIISTGEEGDITCDMIKITDEFCGTPLSYFGDTPPSGASYDDSATLEKLCPVTLMDICNTCASKCEHKEDDYEHCPDLDYEKYCSQEIGQSKCAKSCCKFNRALAETEVAGDNTEDLEQKLADEACFFWKESKDGVDLAPFEWDGTKYTSFDQCKINAEKAEVSYFAWTSEVYGGYCKVLKKSVTNPNLDTDQGYEYKLYDNKPECDTCGWQESQDGVDLAPEEWDGTGSTSFYQCKINAEKAGVSYFAWTGDVYGGFCKVLKKSVTNPNLGTNQGYGYKLYEKCPICSRDIKGNLFESEEHQTRFVAEEGVEYIFSTCDATFDTMLFLEDSYGNLLDDNDDHDGACDSEESRESGSYMKTNSLHAGEEYILTIQAYDAQNGGDEFTIHVECNEEEEVAVGGTYDILESSSNAIILFAMIGVFSLVYHVAKVVNKRFISTTEFIRIEDPIQEDC